MLDALGKQIAKRIESKGSDKYLNQFLRSCSKAVNSMHEVSKYINRYIKDTEYKASLKKFRDQIKDMTPKDLNSFFVNYGYLKLEGQMTFRKETLSGTINIL